MALGTLNERQKMAVILNKFEDMGYAEIAEVMDLTTKAIKSLLSRARARLARHCKTTCTWIDRPIHVRNRCGRFGTVN